MKKRLLAALLPLLLGAPAMAGEPAADADPRLPAAGVQLREIQDQTLARTLGDRMERVAIPGPDAPYEVDDGGMPLPAGLCERSRGGCRKEAGR
jgi:hypothetical protein